jgi:hypothetical protein
MPFLRTAIHTRLFGNPAQQAVMVVRRNLDQYFHGEWLGSLIDYIQIFIASLLTGPGYFAVSHTVRSIYRTERWTLTIVGRLYKVELRPQNSLKSEGYISKGKTITPAMRELSLSSRRRGETPRPRFSMQGFLSVVSPDSFLPFVPVFLSSVSEPCPYPSYLCLPSRTSFFHCPAARFTPQPANSRWLPPLVPAPLRSHFDLLSANGL